MLDIRNTEDVTSCIVHRVVTSSAKIPGDYLSDEVQKLGLEKLSSSFVEYRRDANDANVIAVNIIWESINSERTNRRYVPFLNGGKEITLNVNGTDIPVYGFAGSLPILREELTQYSLTLVMSESYYTSLGFNLTADETIYTVKITDESKNDVVEARLQQLLAAYPDYALEGRAQEHEDELQRS